MAWDVLPHPLRGWGYSAKTGRSILIGETKKLAGTIQCDMNAGRDKAWGAWGAPLTQASPVESMIWSVGQTRARWKTRMITGDRRDVAGPLTFPKAKGMFVSK